MTGDEARKGLDGKTSGVVSLVKTNAHSQQIKYMFYFQWKIIRTQLVLP